MVEASLRMFKVIARATGNRLYRFAFNTTGRLYAKLRPRVPLDVFNPADAQPVLERIVDAIADRDADMAALLATRLMASAAHVIEHAFGSTEPDENA